MEPHRGRGKRKTANSSGAGNAWKSSAGNNSKQEVPKPKEIFGHGSQQTSRSSREAEKAEAERRFQAAKAKLEQSVQKHVQYESSEEEEEQDTENILGDLLKSYSKNSGSVAELGRTQQFLKDVFQSGAASCLICIGTVKRSDAIWSCMECYCYFHLPCIQRWGSDSIVHQRRALEDLPPNEKCPQLVWGCPKCRHEYLPSDTPQKYLCFCGRTEEPPYQPWLVPHSCGEACGRPLKPFCGHLCVLLCHPGPCPPCPQMVRQTCHCGQSTAVPRRCSDQTWSCHAECNKSLSCQKHQCKEKCHAGSCKSCPRTSKQSCVCKTRSREQPCATPRWNCDKTCGLNFSCGQHKCEKICHEPGGCGSCPRSGPRSCPCGKAFHSGLACTEEVPTCGDTCGKILACEAHYCQQRCHYKQCGVCLQVSVKLCRCGLYEREMPCQKDFQCEVKCKRSRNCLRHTCNRKCCDGQCPICEKPCGRLLACGRHRCAAICHRGPCYPCPLTDTLTCRCGASKLTLPCGMKKQAKPPRCSKPCRNPPDCHHTTREKHRCHEGECPACKQVCGLTNRGCSHPCSAPCHSSVWVVSVLGPDRPLAGPWEKRETVKEKKALPCPNCEVAVMVTCLGQHEEVNWPCYKATPTSCGRPCGRRLDCGNHICMLPCHIVRAAKNENMAGENCRTCEATCSLVRSTGCTHECLERCHPAPCKPCSQAVKLRCHCGLNQLLRPCAQWCTAQEILPQRDKLLSCGNQCPKNYECGHRCKALCHPGTCPEPESCQRRVKVTCACKRVRKEFGCEQVRSGSAKVSCDDVCRAKLRAEIEERQREDEAQRREQERKDREEVEKFERKQQGRRRAPRERRRKDEEKMGTSKWSSYSLYAVLGVTVAITLTFAIQLIFG